MLASAWLLALDPAAARATTNPAQISTDPFTNTSSQHQAQVEPDTFAYGSTIVSAFQSSRFFDGGSSDIGWATSTDGGGSWTNGFLPGTTVYASGSFDRVSDPAVAYDAAHGVWLIASLPMSSTNGAGVMVNRSTDGALTWSNPFMVTTQSGTDKNWILCDNTATSPFYGHCYVQWDNNSQGNVIYMSTSTNGGTSWGAAAATSQRIAGIGGQPVVQPNGTVVVPLDNANETSVGAFTSTDGGAHWGNVTTITSISSHTVAGGLRGGPLPSAGVDAAGKVYVVWQDCRFRSGCAANDIVMSTSTNGVQWSAVTRVPINTVSSSEDDFIPGIDVTGGAGSPARLALTYYFYPTASCSSSTCQLKVGFTASSDGGQTWSSPNVVAGPMTLSWLANTSQGTMVGDYISTSFVGTGTPIGVFALASAPAGSTLHEAMFAFTGSVPPTQSPDFSLSVAPSSQTVTAGNQTSYSVTVSPSGGFNGSVDLSATGLPAGATATFVPSTTTSTSTLTVSTAPSLPATSYTFTIAGHSGALSHSTSATLVVQAAATPDYSLSISPSSRTIKRGQRTTYSVTISGTNGFAEPVGLSVTGLPTGTTVSWSQNPATGSSTLTVKTSSSTPVGSFTFTVTGDSTQTHVVHTLTAVLTLTGKPGNNEWTRLSR